VCGRLAEIFAVATYSVGAEAASMGGRLAAPISGVNGALELNLERANLHESSSCAPSTPFRVTPSPIPSNGSQ
jgi:hypothetical protein